MFIIIIVIIIGIQQLCFDLVPDRRFSKPLTNPRFELNETLTPQGMETQETAPRQPAAQW